MCTGTEIGVKLNGFKVNHSKTKCIIVSSSINATPCLNVFVSNVLLELSKSLRYLGVMLDNKLDFNEHINNMVKKLNSSLFVLRYLSKFCVKSLLMLVYHSLFVSHLNYCISVWSNGPKKLVSKLFILQKKALRTIFSIRQDDTCRHLFKEHKLMTLPSMITYSRVKYVQLNSNLYQSHSDVHRINTRNKNRLFIQRNDNDYVVKCLKSYNTLIVDELGLGPQTPFKTFCRLVKENLIENVYYEVR